MDFLSLSFLFFSVLSATLAATFIVLRVLTKASVLDHPNVRSSHTTPTPRGGGLAIVAILIPVWVFIGLAKSENMAEVWALSGGALALAAMSWRDDISGLPPIWRLLGQIAAVALVLSVAPDNGPYFGGLVPPFLDLLAAGLLWIWFINLFNFMDGIDGISGIEAFCIGSGVGLIALTANLNGVLPLYGLTIAAAALGFLWWNWHPAKIFLGDVGSVTLGFLLGWLLLALSSEGQWAAALILPLYYLADATLTLARRGLSGKKIWQAHREHYYQRAVQNGFKHSEAAFIIFLANLALIALAALAAWGWTWLAVAAASLVTAALLFFLGSKRQSKA